MNKNQINSLSFKSIIIAISKGIGVLFSLGIAMVLSRYLSVKDYGNYKQVYLVYNTIIPILTLGIPTSINYFVSRSETIDEKKNYVFQSYFVLFVLGLLFSSFLFLSANYIAINLFHNSKLIYLLKIFSFVPLLSMPTLFYVNLFICINKAKDAAKFSILFAGIRFLSLIGVVILKGSLINIFWAIVIYSAIQYIIVSFMFIRLYGGIHLNFNFKTIKSQFAYSIPIAVSGIIGILTIQMDKIMISHFFDSAKYAIYANGAIEIPLIGILTGSVTAVIFPEFTKLWKEKKIEGLLKMWCNAIRKVAIILIPIMFFLLIYSKEFITLLFSSKYIESASIFKIYLLKLPTRITVFGSLLLAMGLPKAILHYAFYTLCINIVLNFIFIKTIGFNGPAIATVIATYTMNTFQLARISKKLKFSISKSFPIYLILKIFLIGGIISFVLIPFKSMFNLSPVIGLISSFIIYSTLLFFIFRKFSLITFSDISFFKSLFKIKKLNK